MESNSAIESEEQVINWLKLPVEVWSMILHKVGAIDILTHAQFVCSSWQKICKDPIMWRVINTHNYSKVVDMNRDLESLYRHAVDLSCGQLVDINIEYFGTDELLQYIIQCSNQLRRLGIVNCDEISGEGLIESVSKLPLLEHLELISCSFNVETLKRVGNCCPLLKSFKLNKKLWRGPSRTNDEDALAIAETMPKLHHLEIIANSLTNKGLQSIIDGCPDLESLDLRECLNLDLDDHVVQICAQRIKNVLTGRKYSADYDPHYCIDMYLLSLVSSSSDHEFVFYDDNEVDDDDDGFF